jgi:hypothetical protein
MRQGPHHGAHKSTTTGTDDADSAAKEAESASTSHGSIALQRAQRGAPRSIGPTRFRAPQLAQLMIEAIALEAYDGNRVEIYAAARAGCPDDGGTPAT